jgi:hypothetical protein
MMTSGTTKSDSAQPADETMPELFDKWFDSAERALPDRVRGFIEKLIQS